MGKAAVDISRLSREEQLELLDQLWQSLGRDPEVLPLTQAQKKELDRRLDDLEGEGAIGIGWDDLVERIRARSRSVPTSFDRLPPTTSSTRKARWRDVLSLLAC